MFGFASDKLRIVSSAKAKRHPTPSNGSFKGHSKGIQTASKTIACLILMFFHHLCRKKNSVSLNNRIAVDVNCDSELQLQLHWHEMSLAIWWLPVVFGLIRFCMHGGHFRLINCRDLEIIGMKRENYANIIWLGEHYLEHGNITIYQFSFN